MGWDPTALMVVELCVSVGLIERYKEGKPFTDGFIEGYKEAMEERVIKQYWFSEDSEVLGNLLFKQDDKGEKIEKSVYEIRESIEESLRNQEWSDDEKKEKLEACRLSLIQFLKNIRELNSGEMPFKELDDLIHKLDHDERA